MLTLIREVRGSRLYRTKDNRLILETPRLHCDNPIRYPNGKIVYDTPSKVPGYLKEAVRKEFDTSAYTNDYLKGLRKESDAKPK